MNGWDWKLDQPRYADCGRLTCDYCIRVRAWKRGLAIAASGPRYFLTVTSLCAPGDPLAWATVRRRINRMSGRAQIEFGERLEYVVTVEAGGIGGMVHGHFALKRLPPGADESALTDLARRVGAGHADLRLWVPSAHTGYALKDFRKAPDVAAAALALNGGRLSHSTRGYFGGPVRRAESDAVRAHYGRSTRPLAP